MNRHVDELDALKAIADHIDMHGRPPTSREVADMCGLRAKSSGFDIIGRLEHHGLITVDRGVSRGLRITQAGMVALTEEM